MKKILSLVLMMVLMMAGSLFAYEPTDEDAIVCKYDILPEECYSYEIIMDCLEDQLILVAPNFNQTTYKYVEGFYLNLEYFRDEFTSLFRYAIDGRDDLYGLANSNMIAAVKYIPFVTYENFWTITYDEMFDMYCEYSIQILQVDTNTTEDSATTSE